MSFTHKNVINPEADEFPLQCLNILFKKAQESLGYIQVRRDMLDPTAVLTPRCTNIEIWEGSLFKVTQTDIGICINVDFSSGIIRKDTVLNYWNLNSGKIQIKDSLKNKSIVTR